MQVGDVLSVCAESEVAECTFFGHSAILKRRPVKGYRHPDLDLKIREQRTVREARALVRARKAGVLAPAVFSVDKKTCSIVMERLHGPTVRDVISNASASSELPGRLLRAVGAVVSKLHAADTIHGDLTTSNFMLREPDNPDHVVVIDFGLVRQSADDEERAVDLYVLERAISSTHPLVLDPMTHVWAGYSTGGLAGPKVERTLKRLEQVRARGRKRSMIG